MKGKKHVAIALIGLVLYVEHYVRYGGFDLELVGHEVYGMTMMVVGIIGFWWDNLKRREGIKDLSTEE